MKELIDSFIQEALGHDPASWPMTQGAYVLAVLVLGLVVTVCGALFAGAVSWWERRIAARMQSRIGPNRVGPQGVLQFLADALKLILKEDLIPEDSDHILFRLAPYFVLTGFVLTFVVLPFGYGVAATDMNIGLFYLVSVTALGVVGILMSGWSSNSKWALFGGIRAAAQVVSYEIPAGLALLVPITMAGTLSMQGIIRAQGGNPWDWFMFQTPWGFAAFFILFVALLAEGNRTPFDLPEAESELVAGYNTEYSGIRFGYYLLAEWGNLWVMSATLVTLFLGGWQVPGVSAATIASWEAHGGYSLWFIHELPAPGWFYLVSVAVFALKALVLLNVVIWIRWTLPRIRVDQMMSLCWKYLVPAGMVLVVLAALTEWGSFTVFGDAARVQAPLSSPRGLLHLGFFAVAGALPLLLFLSKTFKNIRLTGERVDLTNW